MSEGRTKHYSPTTIRDIYKHFRKIIGAAVDEGYVSPNPCLRIQLPKLQRTEQRFLTEHDVE